MCVRVCVCWCPSFILKAFIRYLSGHSCLYTHAEDWGTKQMIEILGVWVWLAHFKHHSRVILPVSWERPEVSICTPFFLSQSDSLEKIFWSPPWKMRVWLPTFWDPVGDKGWGSEHQCTYGSFGTVPIPSAMMASPNPETFCYTFFRENSSSLLTRLGMGSLTASWNVGKI